MDQANEFSITGSAERAELIENVFGLASSVFRALRKPMLLEPEKAQLVVMTIACLHSFLRRSPDPAAVLFRQARLIMKKSLKLEGHE
jgi:hypothetical protein